MKYTVVCVRDSAAVVFGVPYCVASKGSGMRAFTDEVNRNAADNMMYAHPDDFDLFTLGFYDDVNASFECSEPEQLLRGRDVKVR